MMVSELSSNIEVFFVFDDDSRKKYNYPRVGRARFTKGWSAKLWISNIKNRAADIWLEHADGSVFYKNRKFPTDPYVLVTDPEQLAEFAFLKLSSQIL